MIASSEGSQLLLRKTRKAYQMKQNKNSVSQRKKRILCSITLSPSESGAKT
jgi:hypothetical protein